MAKIFLHVDMNSYFASLMQQENPSLRGKPIGIIKSEGRTCMIAASVEAKKLGAKVGQTVGEVMAFIPDLQLVPVNFDICLSATLKLKNIFAQISPQVDIYSLDEAFIDISHCLHYLYKSPQELAISIQRLVASRLGEFVKCSVGISHNRFLAKLASEIAPKGGILTIDQDNLDCVLATVDIQDVCGIGPRLGRKLRLMGINHPLQISFYPQQDLQLMFGPFWSEELLKMSKGEENHLLSLVDKDLDHMKSVGRSITGYKLCDDEGQIKSIIYNLLDEVVYKMRRMKLAGRQLSIYLRGDNNSWGDFVTLPFYIYHTNEAFEIVYHQLYKSWQRNFKIIKFAVRLSLLESVGQLNQPLWEKWHKQEKVSQALDKISDRFGLFTVRSGLLLESVIRPEVTGFFGDKKFQFSH